MPTKDVLSLEVMRAVDELRNPDSIAVPPAKARATEVKMARTLVESLSDTWDPTAHPNTYRKALEKLVAAKRTVAVESREPAAKASEKVVDLMDALRKSLGRERASGSRKAPRRRRDAGTRRRGAASA
jgi:DNA end-binding protein Ku